MKGNLTRGCAIDANHMQFIANLLTIGEFAELPRHRIRKCRAMRKDRNRELLGKLKRRTVMIAIRHNDSDNRTLAAQLSKRRVPHGNRIDKEDALRSDDRARTKIGFYRAIVGLPDKQISRDFIEISGSSHHVQRE